MRKSIPLYLLTTCLWFVAVPSSYAAQPLKTFETFAPTENEFSAAFVMVPRTHQILYSFKPDHAFIAASLTKLANALAFIRLGFSWDRIVTLRAADEVGGGRLQVNVGTKLTIRDLFFSSVTASANNAATALARISGLGSKGFINRMNLEAKRAGAKHSKFMDASGMDIRNITTARDMAFIAERAFKYQMIRRAASTDVYDFSLVFPKKQKIIKNTNALLTKDPDVWVIGGKTGYLPESGHHLVTQVRPLDKAGKPDISKELIVVVFGTPTKEALFVSAKRLATWAWNQYEF